MNQPLLKKIKMIEDKKEKDKDQLVVNAQINLKNIDMKNTKFIRVTAFINGEDFKQDIPISSIDKSKKKVDVELKTDVKNDIVEADTPDEFFCMCISSWRCFKRLQILDQI